MTITTTDILTDDMLARFDERAPGYDRENRFFDEDFEELKASGYLRGPIPTEFGGSDIRLDEYTRLQGRIGYVAPATALAVNMHCYWMGLAADLHRAGDDSCRWMLEEGAAGKVFCALHGEAGNDMPLLLAVATADRVDGGWEISGHKIFGSLTPVWDYGGFHAQDNSDSSNPQIVHGFLSRDVGGIQVIETWDTLGMRATQSQDTVLDKAFCPDEQTALVCPVGFAGAGPFQVEIFAWALLGFAATYLGAARRAFDMTVATMPKRSSMALTGSMANHPEVQHGVADMRVALDSAESYLDRTATDWTNGEAYEDWPVRLVATRSFVIDQAFKIVDIAMDLSGGAGSFRKNRMEQIFRDVRMGRFHPGNTLLAHELIGKLCLGVDPDRSPRWG